MHKMLTSPKICTRTTLGNFKWLIEPSVQYLHLHFTESLNSYKHDYIALQYIKNILSALS